MKTEEFVQKLKDSAPSADEFSKKGLRLELLNTIVSGLNCEKRECHFSYDDPFLTLVNCYTAYDLQIGSITFNDEIEVTDKYFIVGELEVEWLVIDKNTGIVKVVEKHIYTEMWDCAANSDRFWEALLEANKFFIKRSIDKHLYDDREITCTVAEVCSTIAGGDVYSDFYRMFVGCW